MNNRIKVTKNNDDKRLITSYEVENCFIICIKDYKNIVRGKIYFVKREGYKKRQKFFLLKGRWVHSSFVKALNDKEINSFRRKKKIRKLMKMK